jgi:hypothetical protein
VSLKDPQARRAYFRAWYLKNRERVLRNVCNWRRRNRDKHNANNRASRARDHEKYNKQHRAYRKANRERVNAIERARRAREIKTHTWTKIRSATRKLKNSNKRNTQ